MITSPWGKARDTERHHLAHHCLDVAMCFEALAAQPVIRTRMETAAGKSLSDTDIARLSVLVFLHDAGKLHPGFQAKAWPQGIWRRPLHGHLQEGASIFCGSAPAPIAQHLCLDALCAWGVDQDLLFPVIAHHGRPFQLDVRGVGDWISVPALGYDPIAASAEIGAMIPRWFPQAFVDGGTFAFTKDFQHLLCGLTSLADWLGSTERVFRFVPDLDPDYIMLARQQAQMAVTTIGLNVHDLRLSVAGRSSFADVTGIRTPRAQQKLVGEFPCTEQLLILEAETGSGKTEAALWRFAQLFEAGLVDSLYFALPTRSAAIQIHRRINKAMQNLFGSLAPETVLAVPGYLRVGDTEGERLPGWQVRWDDDNGADENKLLSRWAAESSKRSLAATIAVGTVDQAMLSALQVKHAHLRAAALSRSFLVIDEVHASDRYMTEIQSHLLKMHLDRGGYAMLMSATLGSTAREKWLGKKSESDFATAVSAPYPAAWGRGIPPRHENTSLSIQKSVSMTLLPTMDPTETARRAVEAARAGARVLVIRNTVAAAIATWNAVRDLDAEDLLLRVADGPALHHSRFAPEDRKILDTAVEAALSPKQESRPVGGVIVIGTQTLEQSLDIDADFLITDLCPIDVLLQRMGRLHRHQLVRPVAFEAAQCCVMIPEHGLERLLAPAFENGLGMFEKGGGGIYRDLSVLELTRRLIDAQRVWNIPGMNRFLVESALHSECIESLHAELGDKWRTYWNRILGSSIADRNAAQYVTVPIEKEFSEIIFPDDEEKIRTRLGGDGAQITFSAPTTSPFGVEISNITLPVHWSHGINPCEPISPIHEDGALFIKTANTTLKYDRDGITRVGQDNPRK